MKYVVMNMSNDIPLYLITAPKKLTLGAFWITDRSKAEKFSRSEAQEWVYYLGNRFQISQEIVYTQKEFQFD